MTVNENQLNVSKGFAVLCSDTGEIHEIVRDDTHVFTSRNSSYGTLYDIVSKNDYYKADAFLKAVHEQKAAFNWEISVEAQANNGVVLHFFGCASCGGIYVLAVESSDQVDTFVSELSAINNQQAEAFREAMKILYRYIDLSHGSDEDIYKKLMLLNNEMVNLQRDLQRKNAELERLNNIKNEFLGMAAHDMRTPLGLIKTYSTFVMDTAHDRLDDTNKKYMKRIMDASSFMMRLIDGLLDITSIESGKVTLDQQEVDVVKLLENVVSIHKPIGLHKHVDICFTAPSSPVPSVPADIQKLEQVFNNLLSNALKYTPPKRSIRVVIQKSKNAIVVIVQDEGKGIPEHEQDTVFEPFRKTSVKPTNGEMGTGLGLAIARKIIDAHGGKIWLESQVGTGTAFYVSLQAY